MAGISCVVCAYNEAGRIERTLKAAAGHPLLSEVIVVDDGSTDETAERVAAFSGVKLIRLPANGGKTHALAEGIAAAAHDYLMLLDADLAGLSERHVTALAQPIIDGQAQVSISLRGNSLPLYRMIGLDFISGERVAPRALLLAALEQMAGLPRWGGEVFMNELIIGQGLTVAVVDWPGVINTRKSDKVGAWQGALDEIEMMGDLLKVLSPFGVVRQNLEMLRLTEGPRRRAHWPWPDHQRRDHERRAS